MSEVTDTPLLWNGLFVSIAAFGGAVVLFYHWVRHDHDHATALLAATLLCISPVSFYFVAFYAEPLLLLTSIASLYFARRGAFVKAGLMIALAGATRPVAFLLGTAYIVELFLHRPTSLTAIAVRLRPSNLVRPSSSKSSCSTSSSSGCHWH